MNFVYKIDKFQFCLDKIEFCHKIEKKDKIERKSVLFGDMILLDKIEFCWTKLNFVGQNSILLDKIIFPKQN